MVDVKYPVSCDLCGQPVKIGGFTLKGPLGEFKFCCAGCLSIFQLLNHIEKTSTLNQPTPQEKETKK